MGKLLLILMIPCFSFAQDVDSSYLIPVKTAKIFIENKNASTPMIFNDRLYELIDGYKIEIKTCSQLKDFTQRFPLFHVNKTVYDRFKNCSVKIKVYK